MRILYVAMANSIHVARFISQVNHQDLDLHLFNSTPDDGPCHSLLQNVTLHGCRFWKPPTDAHPSIRTEGFWPLPCGARAASFFAKRFLHANEGAAKRLAFLIKKLRPDIIHSHEIQLGGYLMVEALKYLDRPLPPWIVTNWGNDIYFFGRLKEHQPKIRAVLSSCQYYTCETERDLPLAAPFGFTGEILMPVMPNPGGFRFEETDLLRQPGPTSQRRVILLKGYQGIFGRALTAFYAIEHCQDLLRNYKILIYSAGKDLAVPMAAEILAGSTKLEIEVVPHTNNYDDMLRLRGQARISIGLSVSDAASISFLEALVMRSFPIQSDRGGAHEWIKDGEGGLIVHPEDPHQLARALRRALTDDDLVDRAAEINYRTARERLDFFKLRENVIRWYQAIDARKGNASRRLALAG